MSIGKRTVLWPQQGGYVCWVAIVMFTAITTLSCSSLAVATTPVSAPSPANAPTQGSAPSAAVQVTADEFLRSLTEEERAWLREHPVIRVAQDPSWPPIEFVDEQGVQAGMTADYLRLLEQRLGQKFERVPNLSWQEAYARMKRWEIDMTTTVAMTSEREAFWAFTKPYMSIPIVIVTPTDVTYIGDPRELEGKKVAVVAGYVTEVWLARDFPKIQLVPVTTTVECLATVQRGDAFACVENMLVVSYYLSMLKMTDLKVAGSTNFINAQRMAVRKDWATLAVILDKALDSISTAERAKIYRRWLPARYEYGFNYARLWQIAVFFALLLIGLGVWNARLAREIRQRNRAEAATAQTLERLTEAQRIGKIGDWEFDLATQQITWSPQVFEIQGRDPQLGPPRDFAETAAMYDAASRALMEEKVARAIESGEPQDYELLALQPDGGRVHVQARAVPRKDESGKVWGLYGTVQDITERKQSDEALHASNNRLTAVMENLSEGLIMADDQARVIYWNPAALAMFGYASLDECQRQLTEFADTFEVRPLNEDTRVPVEDWPMSRVLRGEVLHDWEVRLRRLDQGWEKVLAYSGWLIRSDSGEQLAFVSTTDNTDRRRLTDQIEADRKRLASLVESIPDEVWFADTAGRITLANPSALREFTLERSGVIEVEQLARSLEVFRADGSPRPVEEAPPLRALKGEIVRDLEEQVRVPRTHELRHRQVNAAPVRDSAGAIIGSVSVVRDITERRQAEAERQKLVMLVDSSSEFIGMCDLDLNPLYVNSAGLRLVGLPDLAAACQVKVPDYFFHEDQRFIAEEFFPRVLREGHADVEIRLRHFQTGEPIWVFYYLFSVRDASGEIVGWATVSRDITERRQAEAEIRELNRSLEQRVIVRTAELEAANAQLQTYSTTVSNALQAAESSEQAKARFLATMSHELRTPLNSIIGFTDIILEGLVGPLNPEQAKQLTIVQGSARHLLALINDVLDISKIEAGKFEVRAELFDLQTTIERVTASIQPLADKKGLTLTAVISPTATQIVSDRLRVEQILLNLLSNAVKFTEHGGVTVTVDTVAGLQSASGPAPHSAVRFCVSDSGMGVKPEDLVTLFEAFRQAEGGRARASEGTGLGLAISRRLATLLGGDISAVSEFGRGSTFTLILPLVKEAEAVMGPGR